MKKSKMALFQSVVSLILCISMLVGTTFAWFTDGVTSGTNRIATGTLDIELDYLAADGTWKSVNESTEVLDKDALWEPGYTEVAYLRITNAGSLALKYALGIGILSEIGSVNMDGKAFKLSDYIKFGVVESENPITYADRNAARNALTETKLIREGYSSAHSMKNKGDVRYVALVVYMSEEVGNAANYATGETPPKIELGIELVATQEVHESDSFGTNYDTDAVMPGFTFPENVFGDSVTEDVTTDGDNKVTQGITIQGSTTNAVIPAGVQLEAGTESLTLEVTSMNESNANITLGENDAVRSLNVHVEGVSTDNTTPMEITIQKAAAVGLNAGNLKLYHVENGTPVAMTAVDTFTAHNQFKYDPATGDITLYMATFSEVALVADTVNAWNGDIATEFSDGTGSEADPYIIANADQLAYLNECISNHNETYGSAYYKLIADINLGGEENANSGILFYPIGYHKVGGDIATAALDDAPESYYIIEEDTRTPGSAIADGDSTSWYTYGGSFKGIFDGAGHKISNIYQNTWQLKGNYSGNYWNAAMGLFGYVNGGTVKNLTVDSFSSDGEFTPTGVIAAYAANSTFENIAITNCNPRVYNTGNGGIVGIGGNSSDPDTYELTFTNITIDNTNKISALWGSWDVACGGLVGMFRGAGHVNMTNCHVAAQIDVYNDVCGNYQYYWYRYAGMMVGTNKNMVTDANGYTVPETSKFHAENCTVHFGEWNDYYYCELVANSLASYTHDHQFSRLTQISSLDEIKSGDTWTKAGNFLLISGDTKTCYHIVNKNGALTQHLHTDAGEETVGGKTVLKEDKQIVYLPFNQLFTGYGWGVKHIPVYNGEDYAFDGITILDREVADSVAKFETKFTGDFLYRVGNANPVSVGNLFAESPSNAANKVTVKSSGVYVTIDKVNENANVSGTFKANTSDWRNGTIQFSGTGVVKLTIQDYDYCKPTELYVEVIDATNLSSATGTTSGGTFVLVTDVNASDYVYYWNSTLYGNGFTYSLKGAPTNYSSSHGHGVIITKNATLDNLRIVGDVYNSYGAYTNQDYYNAAVDVLGDTVIQNCYISGCAAPVNVRSNVTIKNSTLYGGAVANLMIKSGTVTLEDVTTANYADGRALVGMGIVAHSDVSESAKLIINGTLKQHNFINENNIPSDSNAKILYNAMFNDACSQYHFETDEGKYVNTGIISMSALFNASDITDNANTGYVGSTVSVNSVNGYVYTQPNTSGSVDNSYTKEDYSSTTQGSVPPTVSFDHTINEVAKTEGSNDYCYAESGIVYISMDQGDSFPWDTSILTVTKLGNNLDYAVTMNGADYTGKAITFDTAGDYIVSYTYTDGYNNSVDENGNVTTYEVTYTETVTINVSIIKPTTKHAEFTFGSAGTAATSATVGNNTYIMPNVTATSSTVGSITVSGTTIYYPIVNAYTSDGVTEHSSLNSWYMCYPVFKNVISITDYESGGTGNAVTYGSSTTTMPSGLSLTAYSKYFSQTTAPSGAVSFTSGGADTAFKYQASNSASTTPTTLSNVLIYASPTLSNNARAEMYLLVQYKYQDNAGATYYYYVGYHMPQTTVKDTCVTPETLVTLADGSQKRIDQVTYEDQLLVWDFDKGEYSYANSSIIENHGYDMNDIIQLTFEDGTTIKVVNVHGFFDADLNKWVDINAANAADYVGHSFTQVDGNGYKTVKLVSVERSVEYVEAWSILSAGYYNCVLEGMFSITPPATEQLAFFEIGTDMKYDAKAKQADIEKYGLYTYEEMAHLMTEEQFEAFCFAEIKVAVGKGLITFEELLALLETYA